MAGVINKRMEYRLAQGFVGGPEWNTRIVSITNGEESRNKNWVYPRHKFTANVGAFNDADRQALRSLFYVTGGQWASFRFRDPVDNAAVNEVMVTPIGTRTPVQLIKTYEFGGEEAVRRIQAPVASTVVVSNGVTPIPGVVDELTGLFTPTANWPAISASWSGLFDLWVRFTTDYGAFTAVRVDLLTADIELMEVPV
jgi:uncharacterized protein (TIGR02217 family)